MIIGRTAKTKNCPFCGEKVEIEHLEPIETEDSMYIVVCQNENCNAAVTFGEVNKDELIRRRNRRNGIGEGGIRMTGNEYQRLAARTINFELDGYDMERHALHGMVGEMGEIHSIYQKNYQGHNIDEEYLKKELGDLLWFIAEYCTVMNWKLEDIMQMNIGKLKNRYPEGFEENKSLNRAEGDI